MCIHDCQFRQCIYYMNKFYSLFQLHVVQGFAHHQLNISLQCMKYMQNPLGLYDIFLFHIFCNHFQHHVHLVFVHHHLYIYLRHTRCKHHFGQHYIDCTCKFYNHSHYHGHYPHLRINIYQQHRFYKCCHLDLFDIYHLRIEYNH